MAQIGPEKIIELEAFVTLLKHDPSTLHLPELAFFKNYLISLNATIPSRGSTVVPDVPAAESDAESLVESFDETELNDSEIIDPETFDPPKLAPTDEKEFSDDDYEKLGKLKQEATEAMEGGNLELALDKYTEAIFLGNPTALLYTRRAEILLRLKRPVGAISDCKEAIRLNPDNAKAYHISGQANRYLGRWRDAHRDLDIGQKIDFNEELNDMHKLVNEKFKIIQEHDRIVERKREKNERKMREKKIKAQRAAAQKEYAEQKKQESETRSSGCCGGGGGCHSGGMPGGFPGGMPGGFPGGMPGGFPGGMPGGFPGGMPGGFPGGMGGGMPGGMGGGMPGGMGGGMPGGMGGGMPGGMGGGMPGGMGGGMPGGMGGLEGLLGGLNDPDMQAIFSNPKLMAAFQDIMSNPSAMAKYQQDPEIMAAFNKLTSKIGGGGGGFNFPRGPA